jgi:transcriptional regulator with XRE-family HTH domain
VGDRAESCWLSGAKRRHASTKKALRNAEENVIRYDHQHDCAELSCGAVTLADAGAALRRLRERRGWTLDDLADRTGVTKMVLSHLERGVKTPRKKTVSRLESGLGWPSATFYRLAEAGGDPDELDELIQAAQAEGRPPVSLSVRRISGADVMEGYAEAYISTLDAVINQLPPRTDARYDSFVLAALEQCVKAEALAANSWGMAAVSEKDAAPRLMKLLRDLEDKRRELLDRIGVTLAARFDRACRHADLPEAVIGLLTGLTAAELWEVRNQGVMPEGTAARIAAFIDTIGGGPDGS